MAVGVGATGAAGAWAAATAWTAGAAWGVGVGLTGAAAEAAGVAGACGRGADVCVGIVAGAVGRPVAAGAATTTGRSWLFCPPWPAGAVPAVPTFGRTATAPIGGLLAIAGVWGGATIFAPWRGNGTIRRGPVACEAEVGGDEGAGAGAAATTGAGGGAAWTGAAGRGGAAVTTGDVGATTIGARCGGALLAAASACLRSRIAFNASPGLATLERSNFGFTSEVCLFALPLRPPLLK